MPIECSPVVHAVTIARFGPWKPNMIETWPEIMLMIDAGTKNGVTRRGPRAMSSAFVSSIIGSPPMPELTRQPMRSACSGASWSLVGRPASRIAWIDAARAVVDEGIHVPRVLGGEPVLHLEALHLAGDAAGERGRVEARDVGDARAPASRFCQPSSTLLPTGLMRPRPVTTTRLELIRTGLSESVRPQAAFWFFCA
jgi:hypothetical protein